MKLVALTITRNSDWCIGPVLTHALRYCDAAVVLCHRCTDGTKDVLKGFGDKVSAIASDDENWAEMEHRQTTLKRGRELGGTHFLILDDDEMLTENLVPEIRHMVRGLRPKEILQQPLRCMWRSLWTYRTDEASPFSRCWKSVAFHDDRELSWRPTSGYQHHHTHPFGSVPKRIQHPYGGGWLHFQHVCWNRLVTKQTWYQMMELCRYGKVIANYRGTMNEDGLSLSMVPEEWLSGMEKEIRFDKRPWQADDMARMLAERGSGFFKNHGIDVEAVLSVWDKQEVAA